MDNNKELFKIERIEKAREILSEMFNIDRFIQRITLAEKGM